MKTLMLMRHGNYFTGNLSEDGKAEVDAAAEKMAASGLVPDVIVHSPIERAVETAQRVQAVFNRVAGKNVPLVTMNGLAVGSTSAPQLLSAINDNAVCALAVTHQPNVECLSQQFGKYVSPHTAEVNVFESDAANWTSVVKPKLVKKL